ncbi:MAG: GNAT family N-acetyltransferase [Bacteroidetes bacterium]|nr:GNAT family N-acetyltransferase [Bacteroidota bacterium]
MFLKDISIQEFSSLNNENCSVFNTLDWVSIYNENINFVGIFQDEQKLIGSFYYYKIKKFGINFIKLPPYSPNCGLRILVQANNESIINGFLKESIKLISEYFNSLNSSLTILAFPTSVIDMQPFIWNKFKVIPNYTYQLDLNKTIEELNQNFDPKNRNSIKKAIKSDLIIEINKQSKNNLFDYFKNCLTEAGANVYETELKALFLNFANDKNSFSIEAYSNNVLIGAVFCAYDSKTCYYLFGGTNKNSEIQGINNLLILKAIENAKHLGCSVFDFEGSMLVGVEKFFRGFGGKLIPYYTVNKGNLAIEIILKLKKRHLF